MWSFKGNSLPTKIQTNNNNQQLKITGVTLEDVGDYECTASNSVQEDVKISGTLSVKGKDESYRYELLK